MYIAIDGNDTPYVAYGDGSDTVKVIVMKFNGKQLGKCGSPDFTPEAPFTH